MKTTYSVSALVVAGLLLGSCADGSALLDPDSANLNLRGQSPKFTDFTAVEAICGGEPPDVRSNARMLHVRQRVFTRAESDDPRYTGGSTVDLRVRIDLTTNSGRAFGRFSFEPDEINGTWEGTFEGMLTPHPQNPARSLFTGPGVAHGTGELRSQTLRVHYETVVPDPAVHPCLPGPAGNVFIASVRIIDPRQ